MAGRRVAIRISLDGLLAIYDGEALVARHRLRRPDDGCVTVPAHHVPLWEPTLEVERRALADYAEVAEWS